MAAQESDISHIFNKASLPEDMPAGTRYAEQFWNCVKSLKGEGETQNRNDVMKEVQTGNMI